MIRKSKKRVRNPRIFSKSTDDEIFSLVNTNNERSVSVQSSGAFCDLLGKFCKGLECKGCNLLDEYVPNQEWLCSACVTDEYIEYPYWEDTPCTKCGSDIGVNVCARRKKPRRYPTT